MSALTGRTPSKFIRVLIGDTSDVLREPPVTKIGNVGLTYPEVDLTAIQDALKGFLVGIPGFSMTLTGPLDTSAAVAASATTVKPALSGSHTVLQPLNGLLVPRTFAILIGVRAYWEVGAPVFRINKSATSGMIVSEYTVTQDGEGMGYSCKIAMYPGSDLPTWETTFPT